MASDQQDLEAPLLAQLPPGEVRQPGASQGELCDHSHETSSGGGGGRASCIPNVLLLLLPSWLRCWQLHLLLLLLLCCFACLHVGCMPLQAKGSAGGKPFSSNVVFAC